MEVNVNLSTIEHVLRNFRFDLVGWEVGLHIIQSIVHKLYGLSSITFLTFSKKKECKMQFYSMLSKYVSCLFFILCCNSV